MRATRLSPGKWLWGGLAWAHRLDGGKTPDISGTLIGLFPINTAGASFAQDWAEASIGVRAPFGARGADDGLGHSVGAGEAGDDLYGAARRVASLLGLCGLHGHTCPDRVSRAA